MKKILSIALVALFAASTVFAGISGAASVGLGYNLEDKSYGFSNSTESKVTFELTSEETAAEAEGSVIAGIKGSFVIAIDDYKANEKGEPTWVISPAVDEAYVKGADWSVSILGAQDGQDFASSALDKASSDDKKSLNATTVKVDAAAAPGVTATYKGWTVSGGFATAETEPDNASEAKYIYYGVWYDEKGNGKDFHNEHGPETEKEIEAKLKALKAKKVEYIYKYVFTVAVPGTPKAYLDYSLTVATPDFVFGDAKVAFGAAVADAEKNGVANVGLSAKASYANDQLSASVASDVVLAGVGDEVKFDADVAAKFSFAPVTVDAYYATKADTQAILEPSKKEKNTTVENLISAKVAADLSAFEIPVTVAVTGRDILDQQVIGASASASVDALTVGAAFDYAVKAKAYLVGATASYAFDAFTVSAGINYRSEKQLYANASIESSSIVPGATLKLAYGPTTDDNGKVVTNLLDKKYGKIDASCTISF